ncbi:MAG TPA: RIP metalloprotease RseP [Methylophilus sp.]|nr:RIP metalloprotease RseP [Methylophilus sp.]HQQ33596.1 RIP metalloprotease RseP [Methylophilus sp.]
MLTLLAFIVTISILVTIHEYGHYQVARWCGVRVLRFSLGFGKPLWRRIFGKDQTEFVVAAIPLGGYVKMLDEGELRAEQEKGESVPVYTESEFARAFNRQVVWKRMLIVLAGPLANLLLAVLIYSFLFFQGTTGVKPIIGEVVANSMADKAQLAQGALILAVDGKPITTWSEARWMLLESSLDGDPVKIETRLGGSERHVHTLSFEGLSEDPEIDVLTKLGMTAYQPKISPVIGQVLPGSPAEKSGLLPDDRLLTVDGLAVAHWDEVVPIFQSQPGKTIRVEIMRHQKKLKLTITPESVEESGKKVGKIGAAVKTDQSVLDRLLVKTYYSPWQSVGMAIQKTWDTSVFSLKMLKYMLLGEMSLKGIGGPVTIASYAGQSAQLGINVFLSYLALVSISIGVLNLLPIPVLDGGHLLYHMAEIIKGSPVSEATMLIGQKIGMGLLGVMMMIAIFNDLNRLFTG